ncbi:MAG: ankyrin repeat-containing domain protein [Benniella sp.]|nr:MAG: ankyrin repeat-containing domain protein [Benniella sp.]
MSNIWLAASDGDLAAVKKFVEEKGVSIDAQDENGYSALHAAASYGHKDLIDYLLKKGANINVEDPDKDTPLFVCETVEIAKLLVENGADAYHVNDNGLTAAENAEEEEWPEVAHYLREVTGVPHPDDDDDEQEDDMSHLLREDSGNESEENDDEEDSGEEDATDNTFKDRIETIMKATEADGVNRDEELANIVKEALAVAGPGATVVTEGAGAGATGSISKDNI